MYFASIVFAVAANNAINSSNNGQLLHSITISIDWFGVWLFLSISAFQFIIQSKRYWLILAVTYL